MINDEQDINDTEVFTKLSIEIKKKNIRNHTNFLRAYEINVYINTGLYLRITTFTQESKIYAA